MGKRNSRRRRTFRTIAYNPPAAGAGIIKIVVTQEVVPKDEKML